MKFKTDENLPVEVAERLLEAGHDSVTVDDQQLVGSRDFDLSEICKSEGRVLVTLDLDFADIRTYPPENYSGLIVCASLVRISHTFSAYSGRCWVRLTVNPWKVVFG